MRPSSRMYIATASYGCDSAVDAAETDRMSSPWLFGVTSGKLHSKLSAAIWDL